MSPNNGQCLLLQFGQFALKRFWVCASVAERDRACGRGPFFESTSLGLLDSTNDLRESAWFTHAGVVEYYSQLEEVDENAKDLR